MIDYGAWIRRAEKFVRQLDYLPGQWGIGVSVLPPLSRVEADRLCDSLPLGLPTPLYNFYVMGSADCCCDFRWEPHDTHLPHLDRVFSHAYEVAGGPTFIPAAQLKSHHSVHDWVDIWAENADEAMTAAINIWRRSVPFIAVGNGDYLAVHVDPSGDQLPVVYLCHEDQEQPVTFLSPSFDQFLTDWETLFYVGPDLCLLAPFLANRGRGPLESKKPKTQKWRELIQRRTW